MDQGRMRATVALLLSAEERLKIHDHLRDMDAVLARLERAPERPRLQDRAAKKLGALARKLGRFETGLTARQRQSVAEIKALHFFSAALFADTLERIQLSPPAVTAARRRLRMFIGERARFLSALRVLQRQFSDEADYPALSSVTVAY